MIRAQYHFRPSAQGLLAWYVRRLLTLSHTLPVVRMPLTAIRELDEDRWYAHGPVAPTFEGRTDIPAVQFSRDPPPDYIGREPDSLPYD